MESSEFDIEKIVEETFKLNTQNDLLDLVQKEIVPKDAPGVIFKVRRAIYYTHIQCSESSNLKLDFANNSSWNDTNEEVEIHFWETRSFHDAKILSRKFNEFKLLKKSDSGFGFQNHSRFWYLDQPSDNRLRLIFENKIVNLDGPTCLGPLGDGALAKYYFSKLGDVITGEMSFQKILTNNKALVFEFNQSYCLNNFKNWIKSISTPNLEVFNTKSEKFDQMNYLSLKTYFYELSIISKFWNHVSKLVK